MFPVISIIYTKNVPVIEYCITRGLEAIEGYRLTFRRCMRCILLGSLPFLKLTAQIFQKLS